MTWLISMRAHIIALFACGLLISGATSSSRFSTQPRRMSCAEGFIASTLPELCGGGQVRLDHHRIEATERKKLDAAVAAVVVVAQGRVQRARALVAPEAPVPADRLFRHRVRRDAVVIGERRILVPIF